MNLKELKLIKKALKHASDAYVRHLDASCRCNECVAYGDNRLAFKIVKSAIKQAKYERKEERMQLSIITKVNKDE